MCNLSNFFNLVTQHIFISLNIANFFCIQSKDFFNYIQFTIHFVQILIFLTKYEKTIFFSHSWRAKSNLNQHQSKVFHECINNLYMESKRFEAFQITRSCRNVETNGGIHTIAARVGCTLNKEQCCEIRYWMRISVDRIHMWIVVWKIGCIVAYIREIPCETSL